ncbi:MAG TPA: tetratricopeptide repeat protein [Candidatus Deferrimicrobiaceae bacterium]|nr:tetratricopeptide repeat protein [Candidatus Deferrimicrobiaceae bacterium]
MLGKTPKNLLAVFFLVSFVCFSADTVPGHAEFAREPLPSDWRGDDALAALARLPDEEIPLGKTLVLASSLLGAELTGVPADPAAVEKEISRLADSVRPALRDMSNPRRVIAALNRFLFVEEGFTYDCVAGNPDNYLLDRVMKNKRGNCLGLTALYLLLAERLSLPLHGVYVPSHCFVRYENAGVRINIETGEKGADRDDGRYSRDFGLTGERPYLRSLGRKEMIGVYLKSLGAAFSRKGMEDRALRLYREAAVFYPGLPDAYFNAGVSFHKRGLLDEAIAQYRRALELDPGLAMARDNIGVALAKKGRYGEALAEVRKAVALSPRNPVTRTNLAASLCASGMVEDGIREYRKVLEIDPDNARALAGLTNAYYARGQFHEAIVHCDRARELGCNFDPAMLGALEKYRDPSPALFP